MNRNELRQNWRATLLGRDPEVLLQNAHRAVYEAERALRRIDEELETCDRESIYSIGWYDGGGEYRCKCETRQTSKCYHVAKGHGSERRFRRADVESDRIPSSSHRSFRLGRFVYEDMLKERASRLNDLCRCQNELQVIEEQIAAGGPVIGSLEEDVEFMVDLVMPEITPSSGEVNWLKEGF